MKLKPFVFALFSHEKKKGGPPDYESVALTN